MLNQPPACFAARIWRTASDTGRGALHAVAGEQMLVPSIFYPPSGLITLSEPAHDVASHFRFWMFSVVWEAETQIPASLV